MHKHVRHTIHGQLGQLLLLECMLFLLGTNFCQALMKQVFGINFFSTNSFKLRGCLAIGRCRLAFLVGLFDQLKKPAICRDSLVNLNIDCWPFIRKKIGQLAKSQPKKANWSSFFMLA